MSDAASHIDPIASIASEAVRALAQDADSLGALMKLEETVLTIDDVLDRVPWSRPVVEDMIKRRQIPMIKLRGRWIITRREFRNALERNFGAPKGARTYHP